MSRRERVRNPGHEHKYWTQIPNLIRHRGLSPAAQSLYGVYIEIGWKNGTSSYGERELASLVGCSRYSIRGAREELVLDGWITVEEAGPGQAGSPLVTIVDNWPRNNAYFEGRGDGSPDWESKPVNGSNLDHSADSTGNGSDLDHSDPDLDHSATNGRSPAGNGSNLDRNGRPVNHSDLDVKTGRLKDRLDEEIEDARGRARIGISKTVDEVRELWTHVLERVRPRMEPGQFEKYLARSHPVGLRDDQRVLVAEAEDPLYVPWLAGKFAGLIDRALADEMGHPVRVDWRPT